jgi:hypothetical protein
MGVVQDYMSLGGFGIRATLSYQPNQLGMQVTLDTFYGVGPLRQSFAVLVETN